MTEIKKGSCHCGAVEFEVELENGIDGLIRCNCSLCRRKGAVMCPIDIDKLKVTKGQADLGVYQWNTGIAKHYFCKSCGIYTHHQRRINPRQYAFNIGCIEGMDPALLEHITIVDGASL